MDPFMQHRLSLHISLLLIFGFLFLLPICIGYFNNISPQESMLLILSTVIFQATAILLANSGPNKLAGLAFVTSVALGTILLVFLICDLLSESSERVQRSIKKIEDKTRDMTFLHQYGVFSLIGIIWIPGIGLYGSTIIAWLLEMDRVPAVICMLTGWVIACSFVFLAAMGVISIFQN